MTTPWRLAALEVKAVLRTSMPDAGTFTSKKVFTWVKSNNRRLLHVLHLHIVLHVTDRRGWGGVSQ
uniref:Uncharacterized protein n=1 Tax=Oryza punctata TaxID=4537 RepID=A0A0E0MBT8_ORYPU